MIKKVATIAGSDASGGAGIQADLKTFEEYGVFGFSALTCVVTMDPDQNWQHTVTPFSAALLEKQLKTIFAGAPLAATKIGMLASVENTVLTSHYLNKFATPQLVVDPVMACKGTSELLQPEVVDALKELLLPQALITTPNLIEAGILAEMAPLRSIEDMKEAAYRIAQLGPKNVVVKGGHRLASEQAVDVFYDGQNWTILEAEKIVTDYNHGAGCTFAAAITAGVAKGYSVLEAVRLGKTFVNAAIMNGQKINSFLGHVWHGAYQQAETRMTSEAFIDGQE